MTSLGQTTANMRSRQHAVNPYDASLPVSGRSSSLGASGLTPSTSTYPPGELTREKPSKLTNSTAQHGSGLGLGMGAQPGSAATASPAISSPEYKLIAAIVLVAWFVRLHKLGQPSSVVFDEVHFGGFASKYIKGRFFMDVHPPLAKLLITLAAWLGGFNGHFGFKDIGQEYLYGENTPVPYVMMRRLNALLGVLTVPLAYLTLRRLSLRATTALLGSLFVLFDNALTIQSRFILLDSILVFFTALTIFFWVTFCNEEKRAPFSNPWWMWLSLTGLSLGAVASSKWVGLFTIATVGVSVIAQLWQHLGDVRQPVRTVARHFVARAFCLMVLPASVYLFTFLIHLSLLSKSGDGDGFMSSVFQHTLQGHHMPDTYADVALGSTIAIRHVNTQGGYLHSHAAVYAGGSGQQQITLYPHADENNDWIVLKAPGPQDPAPLLNEAGHSIRPEDEVTRYHHQQPILYLEHGTEIRLLHKSTDKRLHSHDSNRPPITESDYQNEVTGYGFDGFGGDANDNFHVEIYQGDANDRLSSKRVRALRTQFRLRHTLTGCYLFSHKVTLPDWGFGQQEVTCNKNPTMPNSLWYVETNTHPLLNSSVQSDMVNYRKPSFFEKFWELQRVMWETNAGLTDRHAYDSRPHTWPTLRRGINFWSKQHRQVYLIGNPIVWWASTASIVIYLGFRALLMLRAKRGYRDLNDSTVTFYDQTAGFLVMGWAFHFVPFFLMQRQLFLHHYLPALYFSILTLAVVFDFVTSKLRPRFRLMAVSLALIVVLAGFVRFSPITYGSEWTIERCEKARWRNSWDFNCVDFPNDVSEYSTLAPGIQTVSFVASIGDQTTLPIEVNATWLVAGDSNLHQLPEPGRHVFEKAPLQALESQGVYAAQMLMSKVESIKHGIQNEYQHVKQLAGLTTLSSSTTTSTEAAAATVTSGKGVNPIELNLDQMESIVLEGTGNIFDEKTVSLSTGGGGGSPSTHSHIAKLPIKKDDDGENKKDV